MGRTNNHPNLERTNKGTQQKARAHRRQQTQQTTRTQRGIIKRKQKLKEGQGNQRKEGQEKHGQKKIKKKTKESSCKLRPTPAKLRCSPPSCTKEVTNIPHSRIENTCPRSRGPHAAPSSRSHPGQKKTNSAMIIEPELYHIA